MTLNRSSLPQAQFQILLALADGPKAGHEINDDMRARSAGRLTMGPGTLYGGLKRLLRRGWVEEGEGAYRITGQGRDAVARELSRMTDILEIAADKGLTSR